ncbi:Zinc finger, C2H2-type, partial [Nosema bombycis CQ1]
MAYKCPFVNCNVKNSKTDFMDEHFREAEHYTNDFELKCPIEKCKNLNNCELHFEKRYAKFLRYVKFQEIAIENFNRNYKESVFDDLITSRDTIATIIKTFIVNGKRGTYDSKNRISCPVIGCNKRYKQFPGYVYHTKNYKHPISEMISEYSRINKLEMDDEKLKQELADEKYVNGFVLMDVKHYSEKNVFTEKPIYFKNDFYTADARKDKFIYKKGTPNIDNSYISLLKGDLTQNNVIHNLIYKGEKFSEKQGTLAFALNFLNLNEFISCAFYDKDVKQILVSTRSSKDPELLYTFKSYTSRISILDLNLNIKKIITFDFGSVIKIRPAYDGFYFMLFKDGKLRLVDLETDDTKELIDNQFIDFEIIDKDVIVCTDGVRVYKIEKYDDYFVTQSDHLPHAINCLTVRKIQKTNKHRNYLLEKTRNSFQIHNEHNNDLPSNNSDTNDLSGNNSDTNDKLYIKEIYTHLVMISVITLIF